MSDPCNMFAKSDHFECPKHYTNITACHHRLVISLSSLPTMISIPQFLPLNHIFIPGFSVIVFRAAFGIQFNIYDVRAIWIGTGSHNVYCCLALCPCASVYSKVHATLCDICTRVCSAFPWTAAHQITWHHFITSSVMIMMMSLHMQISSVKRIGLMMQRKWRHVEESAFSRAGLVTNWVERRRREHSKQIIQQQQFLMLHSHPLNRTNGLPLFPLPHDTP